MLGSDAAHADNKSWDLMARWLAESQIRAIVDAVMLVMSRCVTTSSVPVVAAGIGVSVVAEVARRLGLSWQRFDELLDVVCAGGCSYRARLIKWLTQRSEEGMRLTLNLCWITCLILVPSSVRAAELTRLEVQSIIASTPPGQRASFAGKSLAGTDLHDLDFSNADLSGADLSGADLRGAKLVGSKLVDAKLRGAKLNLAWIMGADFSHADLSGADLETLVVSAGLQTLPQEAAKFVGANLSGAKVTARFNLDDMRGANLSHIRASADMRNQSMGLIRTEFSQANLADANFQGAALAHVNFEFAKLSRANFSGADLSDADFTGADLTDADLTDAKTTGADFTNAVLRGVKGYQ
jgi:uncharacterized protein YjbI with pentapeptide repeats